MLQKHRKERKMEIDDLFFQDIKCPNCSRIIEISLEVCDEQDTLYPTVKCECGKLIIFSPNVTWEAEIEDEE